MRAFLPLLTLFLLPLSTAWANEAIYSRGAAGVFQVRIVQQQTDEKSTLGSGFLVGRGNLVATNYHVVSDLALDPDRYLLQLVRPSGERLPGELIALDAVHDLALIRLAAPQGEPYPLAEPPQKGAKLYSMGYPHDLGLTLTEGTTNGALPQMRESVILLSSTLNSGMSGGPTFDDSGAVVGVNVARAGDELGLIVPARFLTELVNEAQSRDFAPPGDIPATLAAQLREHLQAEFTTLSRQRGTPSRIGGFQVSNAVDATFRCWDASRPPKEQELYNYLHLLCQNENDIYVSEELSAGRVDYAYRWVESDDLDPIRFQHLYQQANNSQSDSDVGRDEVTRFSCMTEFVRVADHPFKATLCRRDYKRLEGISDLLFTAALVGGDRRGLFIDVDLNGVTHAEGVRFIHSLLEQVRWTD